MRLLSDSIEDFIKTLMESEQNQQQEIELRRNELAEHFQCAPSQINYVLATRFTPDHGYVIESRRGRRWLYPHYAAGFQQQRRTASVDVQRIGSPSALRDSGLSIIWKPKSGTSDEAKLMKAALSPQAVPLPLSMKDALCAGTLRSMILALAKRRPDAT